MDLFKLVAKLELDASDYSKKIAEAKKELEGLGELPGFNRMPVVAHRMNRKPWVVVLTLEDFMQLVGKEIPCQEEKAQAANG